MQASDFYRAVAKATGESVSTVRQLGFSLVEEPSDDLDDEVGFGPNVIDWDEVEFLRAWEFSGSDPYESKTT
ncbi:hypothetical protein [Blastopirellula marina]|uniref:Uncharacterized protein n=1 Tax=Blastopirellula marina TaxID=124 RepID=A0A2S8GNS2_9BACT|nr:hypothetical protein [Blastopirellula marina]PQO46062.1 hypothetical protein C5Y93_10815 [Blastopirellula marina]